MNISNIAFAACAAVAMGGFPLASAADAADDCQTVYSVTDMGTLGCPGAFPEGMNNRGAVVGYSCLPDQISVRAFVWSKDDPVMRDLGGFSGTADSIAFGINDRGDAVGVSVLPGEEFHHGVLWRKGGGRMQDLGTFVGNEANSVARDVNVWGQIVGVSGTSGESRAFVWSPITRRIRGLPYLDAQTETGANAISNLGLIVGDTFAGGGEHAVLWSPLRHRVRDLGTLGTDHSYATAVNDLGQIAGYSSVAPPVVATHAFLWTRGEMQDLGTLGGTDSYAHGINNWGKVVGSSITASDPQHLYGTEHAFLWSKECGMQDLNSRISPAEGVVLTNVAAINDRDEIAAEGQATGNDWTRSYLLVPLDRR